MQWKALRDVPLFAGLGRQELEALGRLVDGTDVPEGHVLAQEGAPGRELFVLETGAAAVTIGGELVNRMRPGDVFGEIALLEDRPRTATVTTTEPSTVLVLTGAAFRSLRTTMPRVFEQVAAEVGRRPAPA